MNNKAILLVEDNPDDVLLTKRAFKKNNITNELIVVCDGVQALDLLLDAQQPLPTLILLDLNLPKISGLDLLKRIRSEERTRRLPVVMLTSSREDQDIIASYNLGANSYVRKPVSFDQFVEATRQLGLYWLLLNEAPPQ
jgi:two-component system, response regulator